MKLVTLEALDEDSLTPVWVKDAVFYQIFPDRFATSHRVSKPDHMEAWEAPPTPYGFKGGDLLGVAEHLDYLEDLGINAIYFNPIFASAANHRYHTYDYETVDPILGGNDALEQLLKAAHRRGMKVVLDGVFNHASRGFFPFHHVLENGHNSPYIDWFYLDQKRLREKRHINAYPAGDIHGAGDIHHIGYRAWWNLPALPKLRVETPAVREYLLGIAEKWIDFGIDGWRLDVAREIEDETFWPEFRRRVRARNPEAYIVGEIWEDSRKWLEGDQFDAVMNYLFTRAVIGYIPNPPALDVVHEAGGLRKIRALSQAEFTRALSRTLTLYPLEITHSQLNLIGSHDTPRFLTMSGGDESSFKLAFLLMLTFPGVPCLYYGDEIGMTGRHDPGCRGGFPWDSRRWNKDLLNFVKRAVALRRELKPLRRGSFELHLSSSDVMVFSRAHGSSSVLVMLNRSLEAKDVIVSGTRPLEEKAIWETDPSREEGLLADETVPIRLNGRSGRVFVTPGRPERVRLA